MKRIWPYILVGVILIGVGTVWTLQGLNVLPGSVMSGSSFWAGLGPVIAALGLIVIGMGIARRRRGTR